MPVTPKKISRLWLNAVGHGAELVAVERSTVLVFARMIEVATIQNIEMSGFDLPDYLSARLEDELKKNNEHRLPWSLHCDLQRAKLRYHFYRARSVLRERR